MAAPALAAAHTVHASAAGPSPSSRSPHRFASSPSASLVTAGLPESSLANHSGVTLYSSNEIQQTKKPQRKVKLGLKSRNNAENQMVMNMVVAFL